MEQLPDSGSRRTFPSGAVRDISAGKGRFDLIPPAMLIRLAQHYENGTSKYPERNWEKGIPIHSLVDSAFRHLMCYVSGNNTEDHLAAVIWNISAIIHFENHIPFADVKELFDLPCHLKEGIFIHDNKIL